MAYEKYNIVQFMAAWFDKDYSSISETEFKIVYAEYMDASGLFMSDDFEKQGYIHHLNSRINYIKIFVRLQREFIEEFGVPFSRDFPSLKDRYGYNLKWNNDKEDFENQLKKVELSEVKYQNILEQKIKELQSEREKNERKVINEESSDDLRKSRNSFIRMLNSLGKIGYKLDKEKTTVEELSLMIKQQLEEVEKQLNQSSSYGR